MSTAASTVSRAPDNYESRDKKTSNCIEWKEARYDFVVVMTGHLGVYWIKRWMDKAKRESGIDLSR